MRYKKFTKDKRSTFSYWFWHWLAFNLTAKEYGLWKPKYLIHDLEKPWLRLVLPYNKVQQIHRTHNNHHLEYPGEKDWEALFIDWKCSHLTKEASPKRALEEAQYKLETGEMTYRDYQKFLSTVLPILKRNDKDITASYRSRHTSKGR